MFRNNPTYLYGLATLSLVDIHVDDSLIQFIVEFPTIYHKNIADLYHVQQLGLHTPVKNQCIYFDLPSHFFEMDGSSYAIPLNNMCHSHRDLTICETYKHLLKRSCVAHDTLTCTHAVTECTAPFHMLYTSRGLLIRDNSRESYLTETDDSIRKIQFTNTSITMVTWQTTKNIFIAQQLLVENPGNQYASNTKITNFGVKFDKLDYYPINPINVSNAYAEFFKQQKLTPIDTLNKINQNSKLLLAIASTIAIAIIMTTVVIIVIKRHKLPCKSRGTPRSECSDCDRKYIPLAQLPHNFHTFRRQSA